MPVMDGYAATQTIERWEFDHGVPWLTILALTSSATTQDGVRPLEAGYLVYLSKSIRKAPLLQAIAF